MGVILAQAVAMTVVFGTLAIIAAAIICPLTKAVKSWYNKHT